MSFENDAFPPSWDEIKVASRRLIRGDAAPVEAEKRLAREYLAHTECEDVLVSERVAIPGYN